MAPIFTALRFGFGKGVEILGPLFNAPAEITVIDESVGYLVFTSPFSLDVSRTVSGAEVFVVGGGGGGAAGPGPGGGGGGAGNNPYCRRYYS